MESNIVILIFSNRENGNCRKISEFIKQFHNSANVRSFTVGHKQFAPCGCCDYECLKSDEVCPVLTDHQKQTMDTICQSDLTYFVVPNYCGYPCANYFAFNERSTGYFNGDKELLAQYMKVPKRFVVVSNTEGQTFEAAMQQQTNIAPQILYLKTQKYQQQSIAGDLLTSDGARAELEAFIRSEYI